MSAQTSTHCKSGQSINQSSFNGEIAITFLDRRTEGTHSLGFPKLLVCLDCGFTELKFPKPSYDS